MSFEHYKNAIRILFILVKGGTPTSQGGELSFNGEARLHAFDFWVRYPDYLADELIELYASTGDARFLKLADEILSSDEPDLRRFPMIRWKFGAYEKIDNTLSVLVSLGLVRIQKQRKSGKTRETDFFVTLKGQEVASSIEREYPVLDWYPKRAELVNVVAGKRGGTALKDRQYQRVEYAQTALKGVIPPITTQVRMRLQQLKAGV